MGSIAAGVKSVAAVGHNHVHEPTSRRVTASSVVNGVSDKEASGPRMDVARWGGSDDDVVDGLVKVKGLDTVVWLSQLVRLTRTIMGEVVMEADGTRRSVFGVVSIVEDVESVPVPDSMKNLTDEKGRPAEP